MSAQPYSVPVADPPVYTITAAEFRMRCVAGWIEQYRKTHGHAPALTEIGAYVGLRSNATIFFLLAEMRQHGFIQQEEKKIRTTEVLEGPKLGSVKRNFTDPDVRRWSVGIRGGHESAPDLAVSQRDRVLYALDNAGGQSTIREIAARTGLPREAVATILSHLSTRRRRAVQRVDRGAYRRADVPA
jgi:SOS-response transcriptional repressor LexA